MLKHLPRFPIVLSVLVAGAGIAVFLARGGGQPSGTTGEPTVGLGPSRDCLKTSAKAEVTANSAIVITATAHAPVVVDERATGRLGTVAVTRSEVATASVRLTQPVAVRHTAAGAARACARGESFTAARDAALHRAYGQALAVARKSADREAEAALRAEIRRLYPAVLRQAQARAAARAHQLAVTAGPGLAAKAAAEARRRAGG